MALTAKSFSEMFNYSRGSTASYVNAAGLIVKAAVDEPRFTHDPETLEPLGLLIESPRTNALTRSEDVFTWEPENASIVSDNHIAPDGTLSADTMFESASAAVHRVRRSSRSVAANSSVTWSVFIKPTGPLTRNLTMLLFDGPSSTSVAGISVKDMDTVAYSEVTIATSWATAGVTTELQRFPNGWYRVSLTVTNTTAQARSTLTLIMNTTVQPGGTPDQPDVGMVFWGLQEEYGTKATSYIATTTSTVTRLFDQVSPKNLSHFSHGEGTLYVEYTPSLTTDGVEFVANYRSEGFGSNTGIGILQLNGTVQFAIYDDSNAAQMVLSKTTIAGVVNKAALSFSGSVSIGALNGEVTIENPISALPSNIALLAVGAKRIAGNVITAPIRNLKHYPRALSSAELIQLTS